MLGRSSVGTRYLGWVVAMRRRGKLSHENSPRRVDQLGPYGISVPHIALTIRCLSTKTVCVGKPYALSVPHIAVHHTRRTGSTIRYVRTAHHRARA
eukprot:1165707-Rhodomonas_salina.2